MTEPHEILTPDELADEQADGVDLGNKEPIEAADPTDDDTSGVEVGNPDEFEALRDDKGEEG